MAKYFVQVKHPSDLQTMAMTLLDRGGDLPYVAKSQLNLMIAELSEEEAEAVAASGATLFADFEFDVVEPPNVAAAAAVEAEDTVDTETARRVWQANRFWESAPGPAVGLAAGPALGLADVLEHIRAPQAWEVSRGEGVTIAVVDTGVCGSLAEVPKSKRSPVDIPSAFAGNHWSDGKGHGSMCAAIAAGTTSAGGRFDGVAPDATVLSARTTLLASDIYRIYDELRKAKAEGRIPGPLVVSNSYGLLACTAPITLGLPHPYMQIVLDAIADGITVVFAAGNNHHDLFCGHPAAADGPNTIWGPNSHDNVISVGTVSRDETNQDASTLHVNSSRGPGQFADQHPKPDCVAPTYGEVVWGCGHRSMEWWGTSGACPQVAGLAALLLAKKPDLTPAQVADLIRSSARTLSAPASCVGAGIINCEDALQRLVEME